MCPFIHDLCLAIKLSTKLTHLAAHKKYLKANKNLRKQQFMFEHCNILVSVVKHNSRKV